jgi:hypothetical protein
MLPLPGMRNGVTVYQSAPISEVHSGRVAERPANPIARNFEVFRFPYTHGGWPGKGLVRLRPISAQTAEARQQVLGVWMTFQRAAR